MGNCNLSLTVRKRTKKKTKSLPEEKLSTSVLNNSITLQKSKSNEESARRSTPKNVTRSARYSQNISQIMNKKYRGVKDIEEMYKYSNKILKTKEWFDKVQEILKNFPAFNDYSEKIIEFLMSISSPIHMRNSQAHLWTQYTQAIIPNPGIRRNIEPCISKILEEICKGIPLFQGVLDTFDEIFYEKFKDRILLASLPLISLIEYEQTANEMKNDIIMIHEYFLFIMEYLYEAVHYECSKNEKKKLYSAASFELIFKANHIFYLFNTAITNLRNERLRTFEKFYHSESDTKLNLIIGIDFPMEIIENLKFQATLDLGKNLEYCHSPFSKFLMFEKIGEIVKETFYSIADEHSDIKTIEKNADLSSTIFQIWILFNKNPFISHHIETVLFFESVMEDFMTTPTLASLAFAYNYILIQK